MQHKPISLIIYEVYTRDGKCMKMLSIQDKVS